MNEQPPTNADMQAAVTQALGVNLSGSIRLDIPTDQNPTVQRQRSRELDLGDVPPECRADAIRLQTAYRFGLINEATARAEIARVIEAYEAAEAVAADIELETRRKTEAIARDLFGDRFDADLKFNSPEEREAFERRRRARQEEYEREHALNTPEGDLNATNTLIAQTDDMLSHGGKTNPELRNQRTQLLASRQQQQAALKPAGKSADQHNPASADPLQAAKEQLTPAEINHLQTTLAAPVAAAEKPAKPEQAGAVMQSAGLTMADLDPTQPQNHGVPEAPAKTGPGRKL